MIYLAKFSCHPTLIPLPQLSLSLSDFRRRRAINFPFCDFVPVRRRRLRNEHNAKWNEIWKRAPHLGRKGRKLIQIYSIPRKDAFSFFLFASHRLINLCARTRRKGGGRVCCNLFDMSYVSFAQGRKETKGRQLQQEEMGREGGGGKRRIRRGEMQASPAILDYVTPLQGKGRT